MSTTEYSFEIEPTSESVSEQVINSNVVNSFIDSFKDLDNEQIDNMINSLLSMGSDFSPEELAKRRNENKKNAIHAMLSALQEEIDNHPEYANTITSEDETKIEEETETKIEDVVLDKYLDDFKITSRNIDF